MGKGERGSSEFVPVEPRDVVTFELGLGDKLGGTVIDEFADGVIDALTVETARAELKIKEVFKLGLGVPLGGIVNETFEDGTIDPLILGTGVELVRGNGERG